MALVGLISDVHATPEPVSEALSIFKNAGVDQILCAGDIAGYMNQLEQTITLLEEHNCLTIMGNHDLSFMDHYNEESDNVSISFIQQLPAFYETTIEGKSLYMVHAEPPDSCHGGIKLLNKEAVVQRDRVQQWSEKLQKFNYDVLVVGHTHQVFSEVIGNTLVINPGSTAFNNCCAILKLPEMTVDFFPLSGKKLEKVWNWGEHVIYAR